MTRAIGNDSIPGELASSPKGESMWIIGAVLGAIFAPRIPMLHIGWFMGALLGAAIAWAITNRVPGAPGSGIGGFFTAIGNFFRWVFGTTWGIVAGTALFLVLLMAMVRVTGVSPRKVIEAFTVMGAPWNWSSDIKLPLLMFAFGFMLIVGIMELAIKGHRRPAGVILAIGFLGIFTAWWAPPLWEAVRPKPKNPIVWGFPPAPPTSWDDAVQAASEGRGMAPVGAETVKKAIVGDHFAKRMVGYIADTFHDVFPKKPPAPPAPASTTAAAFSGLVLRHKGTTPFTADIRWPYQISWIGNHSLVVTPPGMEPITLEVGSDGAPLPEIFGEYGIDSLDPNVTIRVYEVRR